MVLTKKIYLHKAQVQTNLIPAKLSVNIWGRGTGKTYGVTAIKAYLNSILMPRSVGAIGCPSFQHMMEHIFPQVVKSWEVMGLVEGRDFVCFKEPPADWEKAHVKPRDHKRCIFFRNGSAIKLFSFNYNSLANGESIDWIIIDEARLCKEKAVGEALKCLRGNEEHFSHLSIHKSICFVTDMPRVPSEFWLLRFKEQEKLDKKIEVEDIAEMIGFTNGQLLESKSERAKRMHLENLAVLNADMNDKCKELTYVSFASSLENIYALGLDTIKGWYRSKTSESDFDLSVLNLIPKQVENCYYAGLDKDKHGYITPVSTYADAIDYRGVRDCRWDGDIDEDQPLFIGMDYNTDITSLAVGQMHNGKVRLLKTMWVTAPKKRGDVIQDFAEYYQYFPSKEVVYFYDNTAKGTDADKNEKQTYAVRTIDELTDLGFNITAINLTQTRHENRYDTWGDILSGGTPQNPFGFEYNIENASQFEHCATLTQTRIEYKEFHNRTTKDKRPEKSRKVRPEDASHLTEAVDTLMDGVTKYYLQYEEV